MSSAAIFAESFKKKYVEARAFDVGRISFFQNRTSNKSVACWHYEIYAILNEYIFTYLYAKHDVR